VPAIVAVVVAWLWRRGTSEGWQPLGLPLAFIVGFHAGYWLLGLGPARPESHWQWLPWLLLLTLPVGVRPLSNRSAIGARVGLTIVVAAVSGWLLVPTWEHLEPSRIVHLAVLTTAVVLVATALQPLTTRIPSPWLLVNLTGVLAAGAAVLGLSGNLRFGQIAGCGVAALTGLTIAARFSKGRINADGLVLPFTLLVTALMLIGRVHSFSEVPLVSYLLPPVAPLSLWLATNDRIARAGVRRWLVLLLPLVVCGVAVGVAVASERDHHRG
jgi:hypothetical protein